MRQRYCAKGELYQIMRTRKGRRFPEPLACKYFCQASGRRGCRGQRLLREAAFHAAEAIPIARRFHSDAATVLLLRCAAWEAPEATHILGSISSAAVWSDSAIVAYETGGTPTEKDRPTCPLLATAKERYVCESTLVLT